MADTDVGVYEGPVAQLTVVPLTERIRNRTMGHVALFGLDGLPFVGGGGGAGLTPRGVFSADEEYKKGDYLTAGDGPEESAIYWLATEDHPAGDTPPNVGVEGWEVLGLSLNALYLLSQMIDQRGNDLQTLIDGKASLPIAISDLGFDPADQDELESAVAAAVSSLTQELNAKAAKTELDQLSLTTTQELANKAAKTDVFTKTEVDNKDAAIKVAGILSPVSIEANGDSRPAGFLVSNASMAYPNRLGDALGVPVTNFAISGATVSGSVTQFGLPRYLRSSYAPVGSAAGPYISKGGAKLIQNGYNDGELLGRTANAATYLEGGLVAYYAMMRAAKIVVFNDAAWSGSGAGFAGDGTLVAGTGYAYFLQNGQTRTFTTDAAYNGEAITFLIPHFAGFITSGSLNFRRDPSGANADLGTYSGAATDAALKASSGGARDGVSCFRIAAGVLPAGVNVIRMTSSGLDGSNFCAVSDAVIEGTAPLILPLYESRDAADDAKIAWINQRITNAAAKFDNAIVVSTDDALNASRYFADAYHENDAGAARVTAALLAALPQVLTAQNVSKSTGGLSSIKTVVDRISARQSVAAATASLAVNATENGSVALGKSFRVQRIVTSRPARVRLYATAAQRTADAARAFGTTPTGDHGLILDIQTTTGNLTVTTSPQVDGSNLEGTPSANISYAITNLDSAAASVTATFTHLTTEV